MTDPTELATTMAAIVAGARATFSSGTTRRLAWREAQLDAIGRMLREQETLFATALAADLGKPAFESWLTETGFVASDLTYVRRHLASWTKPTRVRTPLGAQPARSLVVPEPKGVVLVIAPWNYPLHLALAPAVAALAAGNTVIVKPSELAPATAAALAAQLPRYVDPAAVTVVTGGVPETTALLAQRFDHILYTGGGSVGRIVAHAAAEHLTPVTLELGGKSPAIVEASANVKVAARRIVWGKFLNAGQTCVAPDYVLVDRRVEGRLLDEMANAIERFYGKDPLHSDRSSRIVDERHFARLNDLLAAGTARIGGRVDDAALRIEPTVMTDVDVDGPLMTDEIFGPLLPVIAVDDEDDAVRFVNARPHPLALYLFSTDQDVHDRVVARTSSGGVTINGTLMHMSSPRLPFGGVGASGFGSYHGKFGFDTFSHLKPVMTRRNFPDLAVAYPPYRRWKQAIIRRLL
ncbi:MAG: aldehyde dehydrogenase family protein [Acidimicrobiia bacterium]